MLQGRAESADVEALRFLAAKAHSIIEVGTFCGHSAEVMLEAQPADGRLTTIDTFAGTPGDSSAEFPPGLTEMEARKRLARFGSRVAIIVGDSLEVAPTIPDASADLIFLDASHRYDAVLADIDAWLPKVKPTGWLAGHDFEKTMLLMNYEYIYSHRDCELVEGVNVHPGVGLAVLTRFKQFSGSPDLYSSVWWASPAWRR